MPTPLPEAPWGPSPSTRLAGATPTPPAGTGHWLSPGLRCQSPRPTLLPPRPALPAPPAVGMFCRWLSELTVTLTPSRPHVLCDLLYLPPPSRPLAPTCSMTAAVRSCHHEILSSGRERTDRLPGCIIRKVPAVAKDSKHSTDPFSPSPLAPQKGCRTGTGAVSALTDGGHATPSIPRGFPSTMRRAQAQVHDLDDPLASPRCSPRTGRRRLWHVVTSVSRTANLGQNRALHLSFFFFGSQSCVHSIIPRPLPSTVPAKSLDLLVN